MDDDLRADGRHADLHTGVAVLSEGPRQELGDVVLLGSPVEMTQPLNCIALVHCARSFCRR